MDLSTFGQEAVDKNAGVSHKIYFRELSKMVPAVLPAAPSTLDEEVTIVADHAFTLPADGFLEGYIDETRSMLSGEDSAGINVNAFKNTFTFFVPGDNQVFGGWLKQKAELIVIVPGKACGSSKAIQVGSQCAPARIESYKFTTGNYDGSEIKGYEVTVSNVDAGILFYEGATPVQS